MSRASCKPFFSHLQAEQDTPAAITCQVIHASARAQVEGALDAANILKPALARGTLHCIGATTFGEYQRYIAADGALARRFQPVVVDEPSPAETRTILSGLQVRFLLMRLHKFHSCRHSNAHAQVAQCQ